MTLQHPLHNASLTLRILVALALASQTGCGAKTGLIVDASVRDAPTDLPNTLDATDVPTDGNVTPPCIPGRFTLLRREAEVMFVIDRSGSMAFNLDGSMNPPRRWDVLHDALTTTLPPFQAGMDLGAVAFPRRFDGSFGEACDPPTAIDVLPARNNAANILGIFTNTDPWGGTPTYETLELVGTMEAGRVSRQRSASIVLCTDGGPNCNGMLNPTTCQCTDGLADGGVPMCYGEGSNCLDDARTVSAIGSLLLEGVPTYVIGIDADAEPAERTALDHMAVAGGRPDTLPGQPSYYSVRMPASLLTAFQSIQQQVAYCAFLTPSRPDDPNQIGIEINGTTVPRDTTHTNGWDWTDSTYGEVTLYGTACSEVIATMSIPVATVACMQGG